MVDISGLRFNYEVKIPFGFIIARVSLVLGWQILVLGLSGGHTFYLKNIPVAFFVFDIR